MHRNSFYNRIEEGILPALLQQVTDHLHAQGRRPTFVEVGANDGVSSSKTIDFISHHEWNGLCVEPVPAVYDKLERNLAPFAPRVRTVNKAIGASSGTLPFFEVVGTDGGANDAVWLPMLSSFDKEVILKQRALFPDIEKHIRQIDVETSTIAGLCDDYDLDQLDILITDAEGFDDTIVGSIDFSRLNPLMINIEHIHITPQRLKSLDDHLSARGYQRCIMWMDTAWFRGSLLQDECIQRMIRTMPTFIPSYDREFGNGYWLGELT